MRARAGVDAARRRIPQQDGRRRCFAFQRWARSLAGGGAARQYSTSRFNASWRSTAGIMDHARTNRGPVQRQVAPAHAHDPSCGGWFAGPPPDPPDAPRSQDSQPRRTPPEPGRSFSCGDAPATGRARQCVGWETMASMHRSRQTGRGSFCGLPLSLIPCWASRPPKPCPPDRDRA